MGIVHRRGRGVKWGGERIVLGDGFRNGTDGGDRVCAEIEGVKQLVSSYNLCNFGRLAIGCASWKQSYN